MKKKLKVLGIDPGLASCGYALVENENEKFKIIECGTIKTSPENPLEKRIKKIYEKVFKIMKKYRPERVILEEIFFNKNVKTAILTGEVKGVIKLVCAQLEIPLSEYNPVYVKQAITGYGKADKKQVRFMVTKIFNLNNKKNYSDDLYDALALSFCYLKDFKLKTIPK